MSHIPNSAMPHAAPKTPEEAPRSGADEPAGRFGRFAEIGSGIADTVREHPKTAVAAGAALAAGIAAAAAFPAIRARTRQAGRES